VVGILGPELVRLSGLELNGRRCRGKLLTEDHEKPEAAAQTKEDEAFLALGVLRIIDEEGAFVGEDARARVEVRSSGTPGTPPARSVTGA
jgi:hypothetical protein